MIFRRFSTAGCIVGVVLDRPPVTGRDPSRAEDDSGGVIASNFAVPATCFVPDPAGRGLGVRVGATGVCHGMSVILHTPAVARFTAATSPQRHLLAAKALGADIANASLTDAGRILADRVIHFMQKLKMPRGLIDVGFTSSDIPALVEGTLPQQRLLKLSPRETGAEELAKLFEESLAVW